ncbi:MAG: PPC domain-containing protein [Planctomycetota bacterium]
MLRLKPKAVGVAVCVAALLAGCGGHKSSKKNTATTTASATQAGTPIGTAGQGQSGGVNTPGPVTSGTTGGVTPNPLNPNDDHADGATGATQVGLSTVAAGTIEVGGDVDAFAVNLRDGFGYSFATAVTAGMDTVLTLIDTDGTTQLAQNDDRAAGDPSSWIDFTATQDGTYYLFVTHTDPQGTGDYELRPALAGGVTPVTDDHANDWTGATAMALGAPTNGSIEVGGDVDYFKLDLVAGTDYVFVTDNLQNGMDTILTLFDSNGTTVLDVNDDSLAAPMQLASRIPDAQGATFNPTQDGTYYLKVEHYDAAGTGQYEVRGDLTTATPDDHGNDAQTATAAVTSSVVSGNIEVGGDSDWFKVDLVAGTEYEFYTDNLQGGMDSILTLYDTNGTTVLDVNDDSQAAPVPLASRIPNDPAMNFTAAQDGTYYLEVVHYSPVDTGTYDLALRQISGGVAPDDHGNDATTATALTLGTPTAGRIEVAADQDWFSIDLTAGDTFTLTTATAGNTNLALYDDQGMLLAENDDEDAANGKLNSKLSYDVTASATYYLAITGSNQDTPSYDVLVERNAPPAVAANLTSAMLNDLDGSFQASAGDTLVLGFSADVALITTAVADQELTLRPVPGLRHLRPGRDRRRRRRQQAHTVTLGQDPCCAAAGPTFP